MSSLMEQLGVHQEDQRRASASYESRVREVKEEVQEWRWRVRDEERERGEKNKELTQSRDMERTLRYIRVGAVEGIGERGGRYGKGREVEGEGGRMACACVHVCMCMCAGTL